MDEEIKSTNDVNEEAKDLSEPCTDSPAEPSCDAATDECEKEYSEEIAQLKTKLEEYENRYLRLQADFTNFRRRVQKEKEDLLLYANMELVKSLLPVMDSLENAKEQGDTGTVQILKQLTDILYKEGLEEVNAVDQPFDPEYHFAIEQVECDKESGVIVEELRKGYTFKGALIRPSMVRVAK